MDIIAAKLGANMAMSELAASGQIGSATKDVYTYDGDPSKVVDVMGMTLVKLSDAMHDLSSIAVVKVHSEGKEITAFASELEHDDYDGVSTVNVPVDDHTTRGAVYYIPYDVAAMLDVPMGLYFDVDLEGDYYPTYIEFAETIKPIDPKYLPNPADLPSDWIASLKTALGI